jgi:hypothetical protein
MSLTVSMFQIRIVVSSEAEAKCWLSAVHAISDRPLLCPLKFLISSPVNGSQILTSLSFASSSSHRSAGLVYANKKGTDSSKRASAHPD